MTLEGFRAEALQGIPHTRERAAVTDIPRQEGLAKQIPKIQPRANANKLVALKPECQQVIDNAKYTQDLSEVIATLRVLLPSSFDSSDIPLTRSDLRYLVFQFAKKAMLRSEATPLVDIRPIYENAELFKLLANGKDAITVEDLGRFEYCEELSDLVWRYSPAPHDDETTRHNKFEAGLKALENHLRSVTP